MANERLSLEIAATTSGQADVQKLNQSLAETGSTSERSGKSLAVLGERATTTGVSLAAMTRELTRHSEASQTARAAAAALTATISAAAVGIAQHSAAIGSAGSAVDELANGYRVLRLALSPTIFTASTLAVGVLVEESLKLVAVRGKLIEQQSLLAATSGLKFSTVDRIDTTSRLSGANSANITAALSSLQQNISTPKVQSALSNLNVPQYLRGSASPELLAELAKKFADLPDPVKRAQAAIDLFGADLAGKILPDLNTRFADSAKAVNDWGLALDDASRNQIYRLSRDLGSLKNEVLGLAVPFKSLGQKIALSLELGAAKTYDFLQGLRTVTEFQRRNAADKSANQPNSPAEANALFSFAAGAAARNMNASTDGLNSLLLQKPAFSLAEADNNTRAGLESRLARQRARRDSAADALDKGGLSNDDTRNLSSAMIAASRAVKALTDQLQSLEIGRRQNQALLSSRDILTQSAFEPSAGRDLQQHIQHASEYVDTDGNVQKFRLLDETRRNLEAAFHAYVLDLSQKAAARDIALDEENFAKRTALAETYWKRQQTFQDETARTEISTINNRFAQENTLAGYRRDESLGALPEPYVSTVGANTPGQQGRNQFRLTQQELRNIGKRRDIQKQFVTDTSINDADTVKRAQEAALIGVDTALKAGNISASDAKERISVINESAGQQGNALNDRFVHDMTQAEQTAAKETVEAIRGLGDKLAELQERQLEGYRAFASQQLFGALTNRQVGAGHALTQLFREKALEQGGALFGNIAKYPLRAIGQSLGGVTGGSNPHGVLDGTLLDPSNRGIPAQIATNTNLTSVWLQKIYAVVSGNPSATDPASASPYPNPIPDSWLTGIPGPPGSASAIAALGAASGGSSSPANILTAAAKLFGAGGSTLGQFGAGAGGVLNGNALSILLGQNTTGPTGLTAQIGAGVGLAGTLAAGGYGIASGISSGGPGGLLKAAGSAAGIAGVLTSNIAGLLGAASPLLSAIPIVGAAASLALPLIGSLFGKGPQRRATAINQELSAAQYQAPTALNVTQSSGGTFADFDAKGNLRTSNFSPYPTVSQPYIWKQTHGLFGPPPTYYNVPGGQTSQFGAPVSQQPIVNNHYNTINAMDVQSFHDFAQRNNVAIGEAVASHLQNTGGNGRLSAEVKNVSLHG